MIAVDSSSFIALLFGDTGADVEAIELAVHKDELYLPAMVITELLSDPVISKKTEKFIDTLPLLEIIPGFWRRAGKTRSTLLHHGLKAKLADSLIAQSCIDHDVPLITRDKDFRHYAKHCGLKLYA